MTQHLPSMLSLVGFSTPGDHIRFSKKSIQERARRAGDNPTPLTITSVEEEFSMSSHAILAWSCVWASGNQLKGWDSDIAHDITKNAYNLLEILVHTCIGDWKHKFKMNGETVVVEKKQMSMSCVTRSLTTCRRRLSGLGQDDGVCKLADLMVFLARVLYDKRAKEDQIDEAGVCLRAIIARLSATFEVFHSHSGSESKDVWLSLPTLYGPRGKPRRVPPAKKIAMCAIASSDPNIPNAGVIAAVESHQQGEKREAPGISPKTAKRYKLTAGWGYYSKTQEEMDGILHVTGALDGIRAGGVKYNVVAMWSPERKKGAWLPPQALGVNLQMNFACVEGGEVA